MLTLMVSLWSVSCVRIDSNEPPVRKSYNRMATFNAIDASHAFEVELIPSDHESVELEISPDFEKYLNVTQKGKTLIFALKSGYTYHCVNCTLKAIVHFKELKQLSGSGASEFDIEGLYDAQNQGMKISLSGASSFDGAMVNVGDLKITLSGASSFDGEMLGVNRAVVGLSGASELEMKGSGNDLDMTLSGSSEAKMYDFPVKNFEGILSGASEAYLTVTETFSGSASGSSNIYVKGHPKVLKANTSGASNITFE